MSRYLRRRRRQLREGFPGASGLRLILAMILLGHLLLSARTDCHAPGRTLLLPRGFPFFSTTPPSLRGGLETFFASHP